MKLYDCSHQYLVEVSVEYRGAMTTSLLALSETIIHGPILAKLINACRSFLPEGTNAFVHTYSLHRDPRNFSPSPDSFWPERWLKPEERAALPSLGLDKFPIVHNTKAFVPFSFGPMHCVGKQLAYQELRMVVCAMINRLNFSFAPGYDPESWERDLKDYFVAMKGRLEVVLSPRNASV
jgi:cytochrome P450